MAQKSFWKVWRRQKSQRLPRIEPQFVCLAGHDPDPVLSGISQMLKEKKKYILPSNTVCDVKVKPNSS